MSDATIEKLERWVALLAVCTFFAGLVLWAVAALTGLDALAEVARVLFVPMGCLFVATGFVFYISWWLAWLAPLAMILFRCLRWAWRRCFAAVSSQ